MPPHSTNKTNLASVETAIATFKGNTSLATGDAKGELPKLARRLQAEIDWYKRSIQGS